MVILDFFPYMFWKAPYYLVFFFRAPPLIAELTTMGKIP